MWGMGSFNGVSLEQLPVYCGLTAAGLLVSALMVKQLNIIQLGANYAGNLGVDMQSVRNILLLSTGLLTAVTTAFCGPVSFIGMSVPHISRMLFRTADHGILLPGCMLTGAAVTLLCNLLCVIVPGTVLPLNAVTPVVSIPVIIYVILRERN